jgi:hypothetical protein
VQLQTFAVETGVVMLDAKTRGATSMKSLLRFRMLGSKEFLKLSSGLWFGKTTRLLVSILPILIFAS